MTKPKFKYNKEDWKGEGQYGFSRHIPCGKKVANAHRQHHLLNDCSATQNYKPSANSGHGSNKTPPEKVKRILEMAKAGVKSGEIARIVGVSPSTVWAWKTGRQKLEATNGHSKNGIGRVSGGSLMERFEKLHDDLHERLGGVEHQLNELKKVVGI